MTGGCELDAAHLGVECSDPSLAVARNVATRYLAIAAELAVGIVLLPYNVRHLGKATYGLWMLAASVTAYFSVLDLGYGGALVKFVAQYRAKRDAAALNEVLSTSFFIFAAISVVAFASGAVVALYVDRLFHLTPEQVHAGRIVLLLTSAQIAAGIACGVFGTVINGFQRYDLNNVVGAVSTVIAGIVNVAVLSAGYGLVGLVVALTTVRILTYVVYRANAYRVFPGLRLSARFFSVVRVRELTHLSVYMGVIDWSKKLNYSVDAVVIGAFLNTGAVALWSAGQRIAEVTQRFSNQLNDVLFPTIVDNDAASRLGRLQAIFIQGTRLSLAAVLPLAGAPLLVAGPLVQAWVGPDFLPTVLVLQLLLVTVIVRVGSGTAVALLRGAGRHKTLAVTVLITALVNLSLSIALVRPLGISGVAIGTLGPVAVASLLVMFPVACRRVQISIRRAVSEAVWPPLWPALVMAVYVALTRDYVPRHLAAVCAEMAAAALVYAITFLLFAVRATDRRLYLSKAADLTGRWLPSPSMSEGA